MNDISLGLTTTSVTKVLHLRQTKEEKSQTGPGKGKRTSYLRPKRRKSTTSAQKENKAQRRSSNCTNIGFQPSVVLDYDDVIPVDATPRCPSPVGTQPPNAHVSAHIPRPGVLEWTPHTAAPPMLDDIPLPSPRSAVKTSPSKGGGGTSKKNDGGPRRMSIDSEHSPSSTTPGGLPHRRGSIPATVMSPEDVTDTMAVSPVRACCMELDVGRRHPNTPRAVERGVSGWGRHSVEGWRG